MDFDLDLSADVLRLLERRHSAGRSWRLSAAAF